ncbi:HSP70-domain-containing protein [Pleomassaria siparia CBS 279.74]|uniref:non-chaperonin molecular chaperone ATPase n=1 Tax=Pleomassaria siparia CBS 279.74 TaxID=1314801 RepID=A0A6G1K0B9_9PLEO|nr:HSP70-domain-containing protein [Pleomassaria siparia CBS 279.74]
MRLSRFIFLVSSIGCTHAWSWLWQTQQPLRSPNQYRDTIIGIHIGPENIRAAAIRNKTVELIRFDNGTLFMPSIVSFITDPPLIGHEVYEHNVVVDNSHNLFGLKWLIGKRFNDPIVQDAIDAFPFKIVDVDGKPEIEVKKALNGKRRTVRIRPEEAIGLMLKRVKTFAAKQLGEKVDAAILTVPADFDNAQRAKVKEAGTLAGFEVLLVVNEPVMAAIGHFNDLVSDHYGAIILSCEEGVYETLAITNDAHLGDTGSTEHRFQTTMKSVEQVLKDLNMTKDSIDDIILMGEHRRGVAGTMKVKGLLETYFRKASFEGIDSVEVIAHGAAIQTYYLTKADSGCPEMEVSLLTLGIETTGGILWPLIKRGTPTPTKKSHTFTTAVDNQTSVLIQVFQGGRQETDYTQLVGDMEVTGILPASKGDPQIEVTFEVMYEGTHDILKVMVRYMENEKSIELKINDEDRLSWEEYDAMVEGSNLYGDKAVERRNEIESHAYNNRIIGIMDGPSNEEAGL